MSASAVLVGLLVVVTLAAGAMAVRAGERQRAVRRLAPQAVGRVGLQRDPPALVRALRAADLSIEAPVVLRWWVGALVFAPPAACVVVGGAAGALVAALVALGPALLLWSFRDRQARRLDRELPIVLDVVAAALRGGSSLAQAVAAGGQVPGPAGDAAASIAAAVRLGRPLPDAADRWQRQVGSPPARLVAAALSLAAETGGTAARAVDGVAATLRERIELADEVQALGAQARLSAVVIAVAPLAFAGVAATSDPRTVGFLLGTPIGLACLVVGVLLDVSAYLWMQRIVERPA